jgi:hypothetical protein
MLRIAAKQQHCLWVNRCSEELPSYESCRRFAHGSSAINSSKVPTTDEQPDRSVPRKLVDYTGRHLQTVLSKGSNARARSWATRVPFGRLPCASLAFARHNTPHNPSRYPIYSSLIFIFHHSTSRVCTFHVHNSPSTIHLSIPHSQFHIPLFHISTLSHLHDSIFCIPHSSFLIPHFTFHIPHSTFHIPHYCTLILLANALEHQCNFAALQSCNHAAMHP